MEVWKTIPSLPEYMASSLGRVKRVPHLAPLPNGGKRQYGGTPTYGVWNAKEKRFCIVYRGKTYKVARLVCEAFHGEPASNKIVCMHLDENSCNNRPDNLAWGTQKQNLNATGFVEYCRSRKGDRHPKAIRARRGA